MISDPDVAQILKNYGLPDKKLSITAIKSGLIHGSYKLVTAEGPLLLQKINTSVFNNVESLMGNLALVTKTLSYAYRNLPYETLEILKTKDGRLFYTSGSKVWRIYKFKEHLRAYTNPKNDQMVFETGKAFAQFVQALSTIRPMDLSVIIPGFHSLEKRFNHLKKAYNPSWASSSQVKILVEQITEYVDKLLSLEYALKDGQIPLRIIHNDSKFDNLLFDKQLHARCIVDLDTVMPGIIHFDVGDCLRTLAPITKEDEPELKKVKLRHNFYELFLHGYQQGGTKWLTDKEIEYLPYAAPYMSLIMCIRFLTDYLNGNEYYVCKYPEHNLVRCKCQLRLTGEFLNQYPVN